MTNYEKHKSEIDELWEGNYPIALSKGKLVHCRDIHCSECDMTIKKCAIQFQKWLTAEYKEPPTDWSKVEIDTPILVSVDGEIWCKRHFAEYRGSKAWTWVNGATSCSSLGGKEYWNYAKLAEVEE